MKRLIFGEEVVLKNDVFYPISLYFDKKTSKTRDTFKRKLKDYENIIKENNFLYEHMSF